MNKLDLSIIIVSYNTQKVTKECIESVVKSLKQSPISYEIIVVDNGSRDGSIEMLESYKVYKVLKVIKNNKNLGFGKANNQAVKLARSDYILFLNSDVIVLDNAVEKLLKFYGENEKKINFLGGKLFNRDLTPQPSCGPFYTLTVIFAALFLKGDYWGLTRYSPRKLRQVDWISGACILTKKDYFDKVGRFDEGIFMYMEEVDFFYRAKKIGFKTGIYPEAKFIHYGSLSSGQRTYPILQVYRGFLYLYKKHFSPLSLFLLKFMLKLKAQISIVIGKLFQNRYLIVTYEKANQLVENY